MFGALFNKKKIESFVSIDIGTNAIKVLQLDVTGEKPKLVAAGTAPTPANSIANNTVTNPKLVGEAIRKLLTESDITATKATIILPGPCVFSKRISIQANSIEQLQELLQFEAANYIPHNISDVYMDFQVLGRDTSGALDVLIAAVKNDIINSYVDAVSRAGLEPSIVDVDYYALENMFELNYAQELQKSIAVINLGARYCAVDLLVDGKTVFTGDISIGTRSLTDALQEATGMKPAEAEKAIKGEVGDRSDTDLINETLERKTENLAAEIHRQLGFFWSASGMERRIESIILSGGGSVAKGLMEELTSKTGISCKLADPFSEIDWQDNFDRDFLNELGPAMAVSVGAALRQFGDKVHKL